MRGLRKLRGRCSGLPLAPPKRGEGKKEE